MRKLLCFVLFLTTVFAYNLANALDAPENLKLEKSNSSSLEISWSEVEWIEWYYVYYGKESWKWENWYESILEELVEWTGVTIPDLESQTNYYVWIVAVDNEYKESEYSEEWIFETSWDDESDIEINDFALKEVNILSSNKLELTFNNYLDNWDWAEREFKIVNKNDSLDKLEVTESILSEDDQSKLELSLDKDMTSSEEYEITVISLIDINWNNIKLWVDGLFSFTTLETFPVENSIEKEETSEEDLEETKNLDSELNSAYDEPPANEVSKKEATKVVAKETKKLPQTWPENWILLFIALSLCAFLFFMKIRKNS